ncbi:MAG: threonine-phosphate decarboxylase [Methylococcales bacterium]|nr:threonine-phosphate decarboxylase [Methylococcales bacterium]
MLEHGGHLIDAAKKYNIPLHQWLDLSTGINPNGWPIPVIPAECWQRLPESSDPLISAAKQYYQCQSILAVAGSQAAIQSLPLLRNKSKVGVLNPAYAEHAYSWKKAGHQVIELSTEMIDTELNNLDVLILINPNNPTGQRFSKQQLLTWHQRLNQRGGWLIIDEAFIDSTPEYSLCSHSISEGLIILRSVGKFFGLAGIRCGFVIANEPLLTGLNELLGPWTVSHPSRYIASKALLDTDWQQSTRLQLKQQSARLVSLLMKYGLNTTAATDLFVWIKTEQAAKVHQLLAQQGILTRLLSYPSSLRFGLPKDEKQWKYLEDKLT